MALWGNKCDLSISAGQENAQTSCPLDQVNKLQKYVLIDDLDSVWQHIRYVDHTPPCIMIDCYCKVKRIHYIFLWDYCRAPDKRG